MSDEGFCDDSPSNEQQSNQTRSDIGFQIKTLTLNQSLELVESGSGGKDFTAAKVAEDANVAEEVHCFADNGSTRRIDIKAYKPRFRKGNILDPTVRLENRISDDQSTAVDAEKKKIYEPCMAEEILWNWILDAMQRSMEHKKSP